MRYARVVSAAFLALAAGGLVAACAPAARGTGSAAGNSDVIRAAELEQRLDEDLFTFIQRVRPTWLQTRAPISSQSAPLIVVVLDGVPQEPGPEPLLVLKARDVEEVRHLSASDATTRFGTGMTGGAILVTTKH